MNRTQVLVLATAAQQPRLSSHHFDTSLTILPDSQWRHQRTIWRKRFHRAEEFERERDDLGEGRHVGSHHPLKDLSSKSTRPVVIWLKKGQKTSDFNVWLKRKGLVKLPTSITSMAINGATRKVLNLKIGLSVVLTAHHRRRAERTKLWTTWLG